MPACNRNREDTFARDYYSALPQLWFGLMFWWLPRSTDTGV
jgi:hypothetical protein